MGGWGSLGNRWGGTYEGPEWPQAGTMELTREKPRTRGWLGEALGCSCGACSGSGWGLCLVSAWQLHGVHMVSTWGCISEVSHHLQHSGAYAPGSNQYVPFYYVMLHT